MSEITPLNVTVELPASEMVEHDGQVLVRCPLNGVWVPLTDYYSEVQGSLLPLVGNVDYAESADHWVDTGERIPIKDQQGNVVGEDPVMAKQAKESPVAWKEVVRILPKVDEPAPEGGTLSLHVTDGVNAQDVFGK